MTAYGRPPTSMTAVASDSSIGTRALAEPGDPGPVAERLGERRAEHEGDVLDRVVLVDLEVAVGVDRQVEQAVVGERAEEVVVEPDAGVDAGVARAVEPERDGHLGLVGGPRHGHPPALARTDLDLAERRRHRVGLQLASRRRSGGRSRPGRGRSGAGGRRSGGRPRTSAGRAPRRRSPSATVGGSLAAIRSRPG